MKFIKRKIYQYLENRENTVLYGNYRQERHIKNQCGIKLS